MKKIVVLITFVFLLSGCGENDYDYICTKEDTSQSYKSKETLKFSFDSGSVYKFRNELTEEHQTDENANNAYMNYQSLYDNYNENNVTSEYKKNDKKITVIYNLDKSDIDNMKITIDYKFSLTKEKFLSELKEKGFTCKEK